jgi:hypothetical protein
MSSEDTDMTPIPHYGRCQQKEFIYRAVINDYDIDTLTDIIQENRKFINEVFGKCLKTPLHEAVVIQSGSIVNLLLKYGADPNVGDMYGRTPLFWATFTCHPVLIKILLHAQASPWQADTYGRNCFDLLGLSTKVDKNGCKIPASVCVSDVVCSEDVETCRDILSDPKNKKPEELFSDEFLLEKKRRKNEDAFLQDQLAAAELQSLMELEIRNEEKNSKTTKKPLSKPAQAALSREEKGFSKRLEETLEASRRESEKQHLKELNAAELKSLEDIKKPSNNNEKCPNGPDVALRLDDRKARERSHERFLKKFETQFKKKSQRKDEGVSPDHASTAANRKVLAHLPVSQRPKQTTHGKNMRDPMIDYLSAYERIKELLAVHNLTAVDCGGNGNCWFHCVAHQLNTFFSHMARTSRKITHGEVRQEMYEFIHRWQQPLDHMYLDEKDIDDIQNFIKSSGNGPKPSELQQWIHDLRRHAWGNTYTNVMLPFLYNIPVRIWRSDTSNKGFQQCQHLDLMPENYDWTRTDGFIELVNIDNNHFNSVVPMQGYQRSMPMESMDEGENSGQLLWPDHAHLGPVVPSPRYDVKHAKLKVKR